MKYITLFFIKRESLKAKRIDQAMNAPFQYAFFLSHAHKFATQTATPC
ncbi:hypothetical protein CSC17_5862 [Klebsiella oxytoca]|nr:hypothetical protein CSC17_5862 [Klebsiella oxytoca]